MIWVLPKEGYPALLPYGKAAHEFYEMLGTYDGEETLKLLNSLPLVKCWIVGDFRATLCGTIYPLQFTKQTFCFPLIWYSAPGYKPGSEYMKLLTKLREWGKEQGADYICTSSKVGASEQLDRFLLQSGTERADTIYAGKL